MAEVLSNLGVKRGMVVYGQDCLDEISLSAPTSVCEIKDGTFGEYVITPEEFGMTRCTKKSWSAELRRRMLKLRKKFLQERKARQETLLS